MANVGKGTAGHPLTGAGTNSSPHFAALGTDSGLTDGGVVIANGNNPFEVTSAATDGQVLIGATGSNPDFATITSTGGTVTFTPGANSLNMEAGAMVATTYQSDSGSATPAAHILNVFGGSNGIDTTASGNTVTLNFDVTEQPTIPTSISTDSGTVTPAINSFSLVGLSGSKTSGSGSTLTVKSPPYADSTATTLTLNSGTFATAAGAYVLPATAGITDGELCEIICITTGIVLTANTGQKIQLGTFVSSVAGTATNSAKGDKISARFRAADAIWYCESVGVWVLA